MEASVTAPLPPAAIPAKTKSFLLAWFLQYYRLATTAACLVILLAGYFLVVAPKIDAARAVDTQALQKEKDKQSSFEAKLKYLVSVQDARRNFSDDDVNLALNALPTDPGVPEFLASLESLARASGATIEGVSLSVLENAKTGKANAALPLEDKLPAGVRAVEGNISVAATSYEQVKTLLANIESSLRLMDPVALLYTPASKTYTIAVRTYYQP